MKIANLKKWSIEVKDIKSKDQKEVFKRMTPVKRGNIRNKTLGRNFPNFKVFSFKRYPEFTFIINREVKEFW